jgi:hypothetical protein
MPNTSTAEVVVAREAIVIVCAARPLEYGRITVTDRRTGEEVEIADTDNEPTDEGEDGVSFAFRAGERVRADHPAVRESPGSFRPLDPTDDLIYPREGSAR